MIRLDLIQGSQEWLEFRKSKIGGSDAEKVMRGGASSYRLWQEKMGVIPDAPTTPAMQHGKDTEMYARSLFEEASGYKVSPVVVQHEELPFLIASMDGLSMDGKIGVEIKCPYNKINFDILDHTTASKKYMAQLQHNMSVCGLEQIFLFAYFQGMHKMFCVQRDQSFIDRLVEREKVFYRSISEGIPPAYNFDTITLDDEEIVEIMREARLLQDESKSIQERLDQIKEFLKGATGGMGCSTESGAFFKSERVGVVDYKAIPELKSVNLDAYRKPSSEVWSFKWG